MKTKLFICLIILWAVFITRVHASDSPFPPEQIRKSIQAIADSEKGLENGLESSLKECQNLKTFRYGKLWAIKQLCPYHDEVGEIAWSKKTILINIETNNRKRLPKWIELLD